MNGRAMTPEYRSLATRLRRSSGRGLSVMLAACVVWGSACRHGEPTRTPVQLTILSYNIHHSEGVDGQLDPGRIARLINDQKADLVALQEVDRGVERTQRRDLAGELAALTGMHMVFGKNLDYQGGDYGNAILSRFPIVAATNSHYRMLHADEQRGLLAATLRHPSGRELVFMVTHLDFRPDPAERLGNVLEIKAALARHNGRPVVVAGDFNDHPDRAVHQAMKESFVDAWEAGGSGDGFTYSSTQPDRRIDYIYLDRAHAWTVTRAIVPDSEASDHLPLVVEATVR